MKLLGKLFSMIAAVVLSALLPLTVMAESDSESKHHYTQPTHLNLSEDAGDDPRSDHPLQ
nr:hypothetical protein [uncultured Halomonas sp.]